MEKKEKIVQRTFAKLDVDKSGYIDADELVSCCPFLPCFARQERPAEPIHRLAARVRNRKGDAARCGAN